MYFFTVCVVIHFQSILNVNPQTTITLCAFVFKFTENSVLLMVTLDALFNKVLTDPTHPDTVTMKNTLIQQVNNSQTPLVSNYTFESAIISVRSQDIDLIDMYSLVSAPSELTRGFK